MLHRLISNLSFNPSLISELSLYGKKLQKESSIRRIGFIFIFLGLLVQIFAASVPPQKSLAQSDNDIIRGGATNKQVILTAWDNPNTQVADIYRKFGLIRDDIARLSNKPNARIKSTASNFWTTGRNSLTTYPDAGQRYSDKEIAIKTSGPTIFLRPLTVWDQGKNTASYDAYKGTSSVTGKVFWILADSGDYTQNGPGQLSPPQLEARETIVGDANTVKSGETVKFRIEYRNQQESSLAEDVKIIDNLQLDKYNVVSPSDLQVAGNGKLEKDLGNLHYTDNGLIFDIVVRLKDNLKSGVQVCNSAKLTSSNSTLIDKGVLPEVCIRVMGDDTAGVSEATTATTVSKVAPIKQNTDFPPSFNESVKNITQDLSGQAAINKDISPGDLIEYKLTTYNGNDSDINNYTIKDYVGDILDYAYIDQGFLASQGGSFNNTTKEVVWTNQTLKSKQENLKTFRVKLKTPLPSTNQPTRTSTTFDCKISNEYGDEISMKVKCPMVKSIETLPNKRPGSAIAIASGLLLFSGYFLARNRLLSKEVFIIKRRIASGSK